MISVSIIEDNDQFRNALETIIASQEDMVLINSCADAEKAYELLIATPSDIVITDLGLPGMKGNELIIRIKQKLPQQQFLVCTIHDDNESIFEALQSGASGYILKEPVTVEEISKAIRDLYMGGAPMSPFIARKVLTTFQKPLVKNEQSLLSQREKQVLELLAKGLLYKEIAQQLGVTSETIKKHLKNIYQKLQVQNKIEAINKFRLL
jgi:two-component system, NarL family, response regulator LiaR